MENVDYQTFKKIEMRIGTIEAAAPVPNSQNLLQLTIDIGSEKRQIVAGIAKSYKSEDLIGKQIVLVANLEPKAIRGIQSNGMLLAVGENENSIILLTTDKKANNGLLVL